MRNLARGFTMRKASLRDRNDWFTILNKDEDEPTIYIYDEIGFWGTEAAEFVKQLQEIDAKSFRLHLNSPGGEVFDGLAIFNALKQHKAHVNVYIDGLAASAASFIAQAGDTVTIARNAELMIHDGIAFAYGNEADMRQTADLLGKISDNIADIYAVAAQRRDFDLELEDFRALMREEVWYTGKEAVDGGLADVVLDHDDEEADETPKNTWDLTFFNYAGREKAESPLRVQERIRLANRQKESDMPKGKTPKATTDPEVTPAPVPDGTPPPEPETDPPAEPEQEPQEPETEPSSEPTDGATSTPQNTAGQRGQQGVMINGKLETDWSVINQHFASLQAAQDEQRTTFRREFVEGLATANKIPATQVDSLLELVNGTDTRPGLSDEQFAAFEASFESTPASSLFQSYSTDPNNQSVTPGTAPNLPADERADRIAVLEGTVAMHRRTMTEDKVQNTQSYIELQQLTGTADQS